MHPAPSVILFTSLSGLGFGMLFFLGLGYPSATGWTAFGYFSVAYLFAVGGLVASTFHLGRPERAAKAFRQWRTSWLSREGWAAVLTLLVMAVYGAGLVFQSRAYVPLGLLGAVLSLITVFTTSMIYTQLKTVPRWHQPLTPVMFLAYAAAGGSLLVGQVSNALWLLAVAGVVQAAHWMRGDKALAGSGSDLATATGLGARGAVRAFEPPHTGTNYLTREFMFVVGRKHSAKLRVIALGLSAVVPILLLLLPFSHVLAALAVLSHLAGVMVARWLFFAEAEHVVGFYYGKR